MPVYMTPDEINRRLERILLSVQKPGRYIGGEYNQVVKDWDSVRFRVALAFPDIYDLGMSNLGLAVLYDIVNRRSDLLAERVYAPWPDMEAAMREAGIPLYSLETKHPLAEFDLIGFTLPYEALYTNVLYMLDLAGIPIRAADRDDGDPIVIAGGHATFNPAPMADFFDAFAIGDGEELILDVIRALMESKGRSRQERLRALATVPGMLVPSLYRELYNPDGTVAGFESLAPEVRLPILKRIVPILPPPPTDLLVPNVDTVHNRAPIEIMRGCTRGCRFCHAGMVTRPVRERPVEDVVNAVEEIIASTGFDEIGLLSLSSSDYRRIRDLVEIISDRLGDSHLNINLPSLRIETSSADLMEALEGSRRSSMTFAPEAGTERMRNIINKVMPTNQVLDVAREVFSRGWRTIKLYFMIGHPQETEDDVRAIADLAKEVLRRGREFHGRKASVHVSVSTFVPKPHTPFQWVPVDDEDSVRAKQKLLRDEMRGHGLRLNWNDYHETLLEAFLTRGDRRLSAVIERAWRLGARFDAWQEHFRPDLWRQAFEENGIEIAFYTHRRRELDEVFPWDVVSTGVRKSYLKQEYLRSLRGEPRSDCRQQCYGCGIMPVYADIRRELPDDAWFCPKPAR